MAKRHTKKEAVSIAISSARLYRDNFVGKRLLFLMTDKHKRVFSLEVGFDASNLFMPERIARWGEELEWMIRQPKSRSVFSTWGVHPCVILGFHRTISSLLSVVSI